jgi:UDP-hydrolysing UDP-N-acetyl-D-glucosamine 2-epimerase
VARAIRDHSSNPSIPPPLRLQLVVGASALLDRYGGDSLLPEIEREFDVSEKVYTHVEGDAPECMALTEGLFTVQLVGTFRRLKPDVVLLHGDRHEVLAAAVAASYCNIPLAHTEGGEVTGSIDDKVRNAITLLSDMEFPATRRSAARVRAMNPRALVRVVGSTALDLLAREDLSAPPDLRGVGASPDLRGPYLVTALHPDTTEYGDMGRQAEQLIEAVRTLGMPTVWIWPNADAGGDDISGAIRRWREREDPRGVAFVKNFTPLDYARLLNNCACLIGNTSSGIKEGAFLGVPYVLVGERQRDRERGHNVVQIPCEATAIVQATRAQLAHGKYPRDTRFGDGTAGRRIAAILAKE